MVSYIRKHIVGNVELGLNYIHELIIANNWKKIRFPLVIPDLKMFRFVLDNYLVYR